MININLFEKKQINQLPYIIVIVFLSLLFSLFIYFFIMNRYYVSQDNQNMQIIENQIDDVHDARTVDRLRKQVTQLEQNVTTIDESRYEIPFLFEDLHQYFPEEESRLSAFSLLNDFTIIVSLNGMNYDTITSLIKDLNEVLYVEVAELSSLTVDESDTSIYDTEITIILDQSLLKEGSSLVKNLNTISVTNMPKKIAFSDEGTMRDSSVIETIDGNVSDAMMKGRHDENNVE